MEKDYPIFANITPEEVAHMMQGPCAREKTVRKGEVILRTGDVTRELGLVCRGQVHIENVDPWGNNSILSSVGPGQVFGEVYALKGIPTQVSVVAAEESELLLLDLPVLLEAGRGEHPPAWYTRLLWNLLMLSVEKNQVLSHRIFCTSAKTIRGRLVTYLSTQATQAGRMDFEIPFGRQQLADYLNLDRSALSKELGKMRDEGLLTFHKNHFQILHLEE